MDHVWCSRACLPMKRPRLERGKWGVGRESGRWGAMGDQ